MCLRISYIHMGQRLATRVHRKSFTRNCGSGTTFRPCLSPVDLIATTRDQVSNSHLTRASSCIWQTSVTKSLVPARMARMDQVKPWARGYHGCCH